MCVYVIGIEMNITLKNNDQTRFVCNDVELVFLREKWERHTSKVNNENCKSKKKQKS